MRAKITKRQPSRRTLAALIDPLWCARRLGVQSLNADEILTRLKNGSPSGFRSAVNPLIDLEFIANAYLDGGAGLSAFDVLARYARDLMPHGVSPHPLIDRRVFEFCRARRTGRHPSPPSGAWVKAMLKELDLSGRELVPFLDPAFILKQARLKPADLARLGASSVSHYYLGAGIHRGILPHPLFDPVYVHAMRTGRLPSPAALADPGALLVGELGAYLRQAGRMGRMSPGLGFDEAFVRRHRTMAKAIRLRRYLNAFHAYAAHTAAMAAMALTPTGAHGFPEALTPKPWWKPDDAMPKRRGRLADPAAAFLATTRKRLAAAEVLPALVRIDGDLPHAVTRGQRLALVVHGAALTPLGRFREVEIRVGRRRATGSFQGFPRPDISASVGTLIAPAERMFCGFAVAWCGTADRVGPLKVAVRFRTARRKSAAITGWFEAGTIDVAPPLVRIQSGTPATVAIAMATYNPKPALFQAQLDSIRAQTMHDWRLVVSDESDDDAAHARVHAAVAGDRRIRVIHGERLGFVGNFERALAELDRRSPYFALSDQDDVWYPEKLARLTAAIERDGTALAYGGMRITSETGAVIDESFFSWRQRHGETTEELLLVNTVTGCAALARMSLIQHILPIPRYAGAFHDMWIALVASRKGGIAYIEGPLQDYVQHSSNVQGHTARIDRRAARFIEGSRQLFENACTTARSTDRKTTPHEARLDLRVTRHLSAYWPEAIQRQFLATALAHTMSDRPKSDPFALPALRQLAEALGSDLQYDPSAAFLNLPGWLKAGARLLRMRAPHGQLLGFQNAAFRGCSFRG